MSRQNKVNPGQYTLAGRLTPDDLGRERPRQPDRSKPTGHSPRGTATPRVKDAAARESEVPGDTGAPDLVSPTGEEMPVATHDEVGDRPEDGPGAEPGGSIAPHPDSAGAEGERDLRPAPSGAGHRTSP